MEQDSWTWGGLITKTALVVGAVLAAPVVLSTLAPVVMNAGASLGAGAAAGSLSASVGGLVTAAGNGLGMLGGLIASTTASVVGAVSTAPVTAAGLSAGADQLPLLSNAGSWAYETARHAGEGAIALMKSNPAAAAAIGAGGYEVGKLVKGARPILGARTAALASQGSASASAGIY